jgi:16S rRNA (guanine527-N7)-methyltransferase
MPLARLGSAWLPRIERVLSETPASCGLSLSVPDGALQQLVTWLDLVVTWSERVDLTAARDADTLVDLLLADAALLASTQLTGSVIDVGSGVGAPAIPLAILRPTLTLTLVEPRDRRAAFLRTSCGTLSRPDIRLLRTRSMEVEAETAELALSRATLPPPLWLREGARSLGFARTRRPSDTRFMARGSRPQLHVAAHWRAAARGALRQSAQPRLRSRPGGGVVDLADAWSGGRRRKRTETRLPKNCITAEVSAILKPCGPVSLLTALVWINPAGCGHLHVVPVPSPQNSPNFGASEKSRKIRTATPVRHPRSSAARWPIRAFKRFLTVLLPKVALLPMSAGSTPAP